MASAPSFLVIGGSGFLGSYLLAALGGKAPGTFASHAFPGGLPFDAAHQSLRDIKQFLPAELSHVFLLHGAVNPDHCARAPEETRKLNVTKMLALIEEIWSLDAVPVYVSTDYVFDGTRGNRTEDEALSPITEYGRQKAEVEAWLRQQDRPFLICRSSKIVSGDTDRHSVLGQWVVDIKAGRVLRCADDQIFSPCYAGDMAAAMCELARKGCTGVYNIAGPQPYSRYDLAALFASHVYAVSPSTRIDLQSCRLSDIPFVEKRPLNTSLSVEKILSVIRRSFTSMDELCRNTARAHFA